VAIKYKIEIEKFDSNWLNKFVRGLPHLMSVDADNTFIFQRDKSAGGADVVVEPTPSGMILTVYDFKFGRAFIGLLVELITGEKGKLSIDEM
jgi:hypothetical protein